jgi:hypothetical protein
MKGNQVTMKIVDDNNCNSEANTKNYVSGNISDAKNDVQAISSLNLSYTSNNDVKTVRISRNSVNLSTVMLESIQEGIYL